MGTTPLLFGSASTCPVTPHYLSRPDTFHRQQTLMIIALGLVAVSFNAFGAKYLPLLEGVLLLFEIIGE